MPEEREESGGHEEHHDQPPGDRRSGRWIDTDEYRGPDRRSVPYGSGGLTGWWARYGNVTWMMLAIGFVVVCVQLAIKDRDEASRSRREEREELRRHIEHCQHLEEQRITEDARRSERDFQERQTAARERVSMLEQLKRNEDQSKRSEDQIVRLMGILTRWEAKFPKPPDD